MKKQHFSEAFCSFSYFKTAAFRNCSLSKCRFLFSLNMTIHTVALRALVSDGAGVDRGDQRGPPDGIAALHVRPGPEGPLGDVQPELAAVHWWSEAADAPAARGGLQPGFRGAVHIREALAPPQPAAAAASAPGRLQPPVLGGATAPFRRCGDQRAGYDELRTGRLALGAVLQHWCVPVQPAKASECGPGLALRSVKRAILNLNATLLFVSRPFTSPSSPRSPWVRLRLYRLALDPRRGPHWDGKAGKMRKGWRSECCMHMNRSVI